MLRIQLHQLCRRAFATKLTSHQELLMARSLPKRVPLLDVQHIVVVASGKGGVGKSSVSVNLAVSLAMLGKRVGLLDADIFGPSVPLMMHISEEPLVDDKQMMIPPLNYGVKCLSMGLLAQPDDAIVWRGPLVMSAVQRLLKRAVWGPLDVLIVDTPPGTGDVHLSLAQNVPITGVLLVSTPQAAALEVTLRGAQMYRKMCVPILGLVENMGHMVCGNCKERVDMFLSKTPEFADKIQTRVLTSLPLEPRFAECCDKGVPLVIQHRDSDHASKYRMLADDLVQMLARDRKLKEGV